MITAEVMQLHQLDSRLQVAAWRSHRSFKINSEYSLCCAVFFAAFESIKCNAKATVLRQLKCHVIFQALAVRCHAANLYKGMLHHLHYVFLGIIEP
jgi:hypothetical protein